MDSKAFLSYLNLMKFDFCIIFFAFAVFLQNMVVTQLVEDKACLNHLQLNQSFCSEFTSYPESIETQEIIRIANSFKRWQFNLTHMPCLLLSIFVGYWLGNYPKYFKFMVLSAFLGGICLILLLLVNLFAFEASWWAIIFSYIPISLSGGNFLLFSAIYTSISWGTPSHLVIVRFSVIEFFVKTAMLSSSYSSGTILAMEPWIGDQRKNFVGVLLTSLSSYTLGLIYTIAMKPSFVVTKNPEKDDASFPQVIKDVFRLMRAKECLAIFSVKRPNQGRLRLILLITSGAICNAALNSEDSIAYQFAQRVYGLTEKAYTSMLTLVYIPPTIATSTVPSLLRLLHLSDSSIAIFGCSSLSAFFVIRGIFLSVRGYIAGYIIGSCGRISSVAIRSLIVATVDSAESAQIFTLSTALETFVGLGATFMCTSVFSLTIAHQPGAVMLLVGTIILYPLTVSLWIRFVQNKKIKIVTETQNDETK
uniref:Major facilitator superfamily (MFS) profile domain-containing protein n=2 Tax=Tetranychus urticae TaxID=32264 RepID=T1JWC7_TETUR